MGKGSNNPKGLEAIRKKDWEDTLLLYAETLAEIYQEFSPEARKKILRMARKIKVPKKRKQMGRRL